MKLRTAIVLFILILLSGCKATEEMSQTNTSQEVSSIVQTEVSQTSISQSTSILSNYLPQSWENSLTETPSSFDELASPQAPKPITEVEEPITVTGNYKMPVITNATDLMYLMPEIDMSVVMAHVHSGYIHDIPGAGYSPEYFLEVEKDYLAVNYLRQTKEGCYYTVCKVRDGGYAYAFFERPYNIGKQDYYTDDVTNVYLTGMVYAENALQKSDFDSLQTGDSIDQVIEIDSAAKITKQWSNWNKDITGKAISINVSIHLLKDGLLSIEYDESFAIKNITFSEDFIFHPVLNPNYPKYFGILPQDYPPET